MSCIRVTHSKTDSALLLLVEETHLFCGEISWLTMLQLEKAGLLLLVGFVTGGGEMSLIVLQLDNWESAFETGETELHSSLLLPVVQEERGEGGVMLLLGRGHRSEMPWTIALQLENL